jgi:hypothetical protein
MQIQRHIEQLTTPRLVLDLPPSFANQRVEVLVLTLDDAPPQIPRKRRVPPPQFAGKVKELGDVINTIPLADWSLPA